MNQNEPKVYERVLSILAFFFPFIELSYYFSAKVFLSTESSFLKSIYINYINKFSNFYANNVYFIFIFMVGVFMICARGTLPLSKYVRFNIIQAILLNIIYSCIGSIYSYFPVILRESAIGIILANFFYIGFIILFAYSAILIFYGRVPTIPVVSTAAKLNVQENQ
jgi:hypothetical protein